MRRKNKPLPPLVILRDMPCKNQTIYVANDGGCLRCGAVQGEACRDVAATNRETQEG